MSGADSTYVAALANAAETHAGSTAQADRDFVGSVADAYETYQTQAAQALRDGALGAGSDPFFVFSCSSS